MPLSHKPLETITEADLQGLINQGVSEGRRIEYKRDLPGGKDDDKKEFLADVSSFANAAGGDLLFGISEDRGAPVALAPINGVDMDAEVLRLESIIRTSIAPRIPGVHWRAIPISPGGFVLVGRIPQSWALPHMVTFKGGSRFFSRNSAGKYPIDVDELRALFARSTDTAERIRQFRAERLARIIAGEGTFPLTGSAFIVLHVLPFRMFDPAYRFDLQSVSSSPSNLSPLRGFGFSWRHNLDGFTTYAPDGSGGIYSYTQVFRHGGIEAVEGGLLNREGKVIPDTTLGFEIAEKLPRYLHTQRSIGVDPPIVVLLTLVGVKGYVIPEEDTELLLDRPTIDRDLVPAPEVILDDWTVDPIAAMRPAFDTIWNAAGLPRSRLYRPDGTWISR